ncbi:helix-turn-helix transcriptional regulator [Actinoplanes sp. G11-F43]|uniref:helix-turn-helix transcriptional regulator n=1 Tax=Actinoplanes sp. G11-F43 TaxID=3424130 RepID=UPI003D35126D
MRTSRLFTMVLLLQSRGTVTAAELAAELGVSERTVYRDIGELSAAGVPVYAEQGRLGGYRLVDGYRTRLSGLNQAEAEALFLLGLDGPVRDMGLSDLLDSASLKALPSRLRRTQRFHLDVPGWFHHGEPPPMLTDLVGAVWQDLVVTVRYQRRDAEVSRLIHPYGVVLKGGVWYLVARVDGEPRIYRVDRIRSVETDGERFARDASFDLAAVWAERSERFQRELATVEVTVRLSADGMRALRFAVEPPAVQAAEATASTPDDQGRIVVRLPLESLEVAYDQLLRLGPEAEVLSPEPLRERMRAAAPRLHEHYQR